MEVQLHKCATEGCSNNILNGRLCTDCMWDQADFDGSRKKHAEAKQHRSKEKRSWIPFKRKKNGKIYS